MARDPVTQFRVIDALWKLALVLGLGLAAAPLDDVADRRRQCGGECAQHKQHEDEFEQREAAGAASLVQA